MLSAHTLTVHSRQRTGSRYCRRERSAGRLPGVLYGHGMAPVSISLDAKEALRFFHQGEKIFSVDLEGEAKAQTVMLKDLQFDYLGTNIVHVDLTRVDLNEEIEANVTLRFVGDAIGLKKAGAILTHPTKSVGVRCTVRTLPDHIDVDIAALDLGGSVHVRAITMPEGVTLESDPDAVIAAISVAKVEEVVAEAVVVEGEAAQPEVITEKKKEEGVEDAKKEKKDKKD